MDAKKNDTAIKVMVIDDDKEFLDEMSEMLRLSGYDPTPLSDSADAAAKACESLPDIILLDLKMDKKSGFEVADELTSKPETRSIPIIAITGVFMHKERHLFMKLRNIRHCLIKPIKPLDVIHLIEKAV